MIGMTYSVNITFLDNYAQFEHMPSLISPMVVPEYPVELVRPGIAGDVYVVIDVKSSGGINAIHIEKTTPVEMSHVVKSLFENSVTKAVSQWKFDKDRMENLDLSHDLIRLRCLVQFRVVSGKDSKQRAELLEVMP